MRILFLGDIIGKPGRQAVKRLLPALRKRYNPALVIANGENSAGGFGITEDVYAELIGEGVDVITSGNHIWDRKEVLNFIDNADRLLRPLNYPEGSPGTGVRVFRKDDVEIAVVNLCGRAFMENIDCPFRAASRCLDGLGEKSPVIIVDMHAETTSEKIAMGWYLDGRVSAVIGTHTHVQTSDERILPKGTAYITDAGMTGPVDSVIGMKKELVIKRFLTQMPVRFEVATGRLELQGVVLEIEPSTGKATHIERIKEEV
ncbi:MAG TPA: TIGR00282 family metallophosphoesterase [Deltaproteobacteria bacterium]|nr:TIGR00282 family metallophosphoesterase [Deltaproteobacteria bacterium]